MNVARKAILDQEGRTDFKDLLDLSDLKVFKANEVKTDNPVQKGNVANKVKKGIQANEVRKVFKVHRVLKARTVEMVEMVLEFHKN